MSETWHERISDAVEELGLNPPKSNGEGKE